MRLKFLLATLLVAAVPVWAAAASSSDLQARRDALNKLLAEQWEYSLSHAPEFASILGDKRWNDQISDFSQAAIDADHAKTRDFLQRFEAIDTTGFPEQEALNQALMVRNLKEELEGAKFKGWLMPVNQISGIHLLVAQFPSLLSFTTVKDYDDLITRYKKFPRAFDQTIDHMRAGMAAGLMPPKFLLEKVAVQVDGLAHVPAEKSPFAAPLEKLPKEIPEAEQTRIREQMLAAINGSILPAYVKLGRFVKEEYLPKGRTEPGMWSLPDGAARYAFAVKESTTTNLTPEEIHQIGLREVKRIEGQMAELAKQLGYPDAKALNAAIEADPKRHFHSRQEILDLYKHYIDQMYGKLPELFGRLPKAKVEVVPVEEFREKEASGAQYDTGAPDGSRPGRVQVNTGDAEHRKTITTESTAYHEGVPGHHMQLSIAQELPTLPPFRQQGGYTAFAEGWALYSERLGKEVGFYQDPYSDYGRLQDEMLRAIRLVVDTGFHSKHWSRDQVVKFFHDHSGIDEVEVQSETDRYIVWPGQALAYKIGQLKITELRERAKKALGPRFDIRKFHDEVLGAGALPLDVLERRIDNWIAAEK
ncbi:MAG TPA: DUF885 family protein [Thermoanaerobaculia bacterium]|jgi:uncharacterized protein (DUF885 family)|nr:DUF885 family protein [Thermoanaerobaculia bacterium]